MRFLTARAAKTLKPAGASRPGRVQRWLRSRRLAVGICAAIVVASGGGWWAQRNGLLAATAAIAEQHLLAATADLGLAVTTVQVEGRTRASREAILGALGVARGMPILAVDAAQAKTRIEAIAWVRSASVERRLPDTVYVRVAEREPLAFWQRQGKLVLVDRDGVVVPSDHAESFGNLIVLVGADAPKSGAALLDMLATETDLVPHVAAAVRVGGRRWNLRLDSGIDVALPEENPTAAWHLLADLERSDGILERDIQMVDLRLPDRLVVRTTPAEAAKTPAKKPRQPGKAT
jgi:cell division protein FtsQ